MNLLKTIQHLNHQLNLANKTQDHNVLWSFCLDNYFEILEKPEKPTKKVLEKPKKGDGIMFYRKIETKLFEYYNDPTAKIIVINGARQIGKSFIIRETAKKHFPIYMIMFV